MSTTPWPGRVVMCIPTYNEADNLAWIVGRLRAAQPDVHVLVVDDGSPDGTGKIADELAAADEAVQVLHRTEKGGLGAAYRHGFRVALEQGVRRHRGDGRRRLPPARAAAPAARRPRRRRPRHRARWIPGGSVVNWPRRREALSRGGNLYVRTLLGIRVHDATAGYRVFRRQALEAIELETVQSTGYVFQTDMVVRCLRRGLRVREVPIEFVERERGDSKMSGRVAAESLARITALGAARAPRPGRAAVAAPVTASYGSRRPRRRRFPWWLVVVAFVVVPILEIYVIIQVGQVIGAGWTIALLIADSIFGAWLIRREGRRSWEALNSALGSGRMPASELADGGLILVGGTLMLSPGFVTDALGILLILPFTRPLFRRVLPGAVTRRLLVGRGPGPGPQGPVRRPVPVHKPVRPGARSCGDPRRLGISSVA